MGFDDSGALPGDWLPKPAKEGTGATPNKGAGFGVSAEACVVDEVFAWFAAAPNANGAGADTASALGTPPNNDGVTIGSSLTGVSARGCPYN